MWLGFEPAPSQSGWLGGSSADSILVQLQLLEAVAGLPLAGRPRQIESPYRPARMRRLPVWVLHRGEAPTFRTAQLAVGCLAGAVQDLLRGAAQGSLGQTRGRPPHEPCAEHASCCDGHALHQQRAQPLHQGQRPTRGAAPGPTKDSKLADEAERLREPSSPPLCCHCRSLPPPPPSAATPSLPPPLTSHSPGAEGCMLLLPYRLLDRLLLPLVARPSVLSPGWMPWVDAQPWVYPPSCPSQLCLLGVAGAWAGEQGSGGGCAGVCLHLLLPAAHLHILLLLQQQTTCPLTALIDQASAIVCLQGEIAHGSGGMPAAD
ncbi:hypothetical protein V8C86DRAFT_2432146 [Haematococcus lacustris]